MLTGAMRQLHPPVSLHDRCDSRVQVKSLTPRIISISAQGKTAAQAESIANAVANSYVAYISSTLARWAGSRHGCCRRRRSLPGRRWPNVCSSPEGLGLLAAR